jgi:hypothetical protein
LFGSAIKEGIGTDYQDADIRGLEVGEDAVQLAVGAGLQNGDGQAQRTSSISCDFEDRSTLTGIDRHQSGLLLAPSTSAPSRSITYSVSEVDFAFHVPLN